MPNIMQIEEYLSKLEATPYADSSACTIERPYLIVSANVKHKYDITMENYSDGSFSEQSVIGLKTLVVRYNYHSHSENYRAENSVMVTVQSYGSYLIYFDLTKNLCIGYDNIKGPALPKFISGGDSREFYPPFYFIIGKIEKHLATSEEVVNQKESEDIE